LAIGVDPAIDLEAAEIGPGTYADGKAVDLGFFLIIFYVLRKIKGNSKKFKK
jgi:hypothetical protein